MLPPGSQLGPYTITNPLAAGGRPSGLPTRRASSTTHSARHEGRAAVSGQHGGTDPASGDGCVGLDRGAKEV